MHGTMSFDLLLKDDARPQGAEIAISDDSDCKGLRVGDLKRLICKRVTWLTYLKGLLSERDDEA